VGVIESTNDARFVHDGLEEHGWDVLTATGPEHSRRAGARAGSGCTWFAIARR
jgi:hypothetical protein